MALQVKLVGNRGNLAAHDAYLTTHFVWMKLSRLISNGTVWMNMAPWYHCTAYGL